MAAMSSASSSSWQASLFSSAQDFSSPIISSVVSQPSQGKSGFGGRILYLRSSPPPFRNVSSILRNSATLHSSSVPSLVCSSISLQTQDFPSPNRGGVESSGSQNLSGRERRKLRNERREAHKLAQEQPWKEAVEDRLLEPKKKIKTWQEDADINRCIEKGVQWWMLQTTRKYEFDVAEQIDIILPEKFPGREFKVIVPTVPVKTKLKDGSVSQARKKLYEGIVLLRCLLDRDVYVTVKNIPRAYEFFGTQAGHSLQPIVMPAPVSDFNMDRMFQKIRKQQEEYEEFKEQCRIELAEQKKEKKRKDEEQKQNEMEKRVLKSKSLVLAVGCTIRVLSGPFLDFTGVVIELLPENKVKAIVTVFGNDTPIVLDAREVAIEAAASHWKS
ncbi:unnamed protein product [Calypogeia fissa]